VTLEATILLAIFAPLATVAGVGYKIGGKLNSVANCLDSMRKELAEVSKDNMRLSAEVKALQSLINALLKK